MKLKFTTKSGTLALLLWRLVLSLFFITVSRLLLYGFNAGLFPGLGVKDLIYLLVTGLRFDLATVVLLNIPFIILLLLPHKWRCTKFYRVICDSYYYIVNLVAVAVNFIDIAYFRFTFKRTTWEVFDFIDKNRDEFISLIPDFIKDFPFLFLLFFVFVFLFFRLSALVKCDKTRYESYSAGNFLRDLVLLVMVTALTVIAGRGGFQRRPLSIINAGDYTQPAYFAVVLNTPFTIMKTMNKPAVKKVTYFDSEEELEKVFDPVVRAVPEGNGFRRLNVFVIILESFSAEESAYLNPGLEGGNYRGFTPILDSIMRHSLVFHGYANGMRSIEGIPAILSSIPSLSETPYLSSSFVSNSIYSLAGLLKRKGYSSAFFHGGTNGTMSFDSYAKIAGFDEYYGRTEYGDDSDFDGNWGIFDEPFLSFTARKLNGMKKPFCAAVFTLSSHHPFTIPAKYKGRFRKGKTPIQESIMYADYSLGKFFEKVSKYPWFDSTLFVITADHTSMVYHKELNNRLGRYGIPVVFYMHNLWNDTVSPSIAQQTDIMPSVLDFLNFDDDYVAFGYSVFDTSKHHFAISYSNGVYQMIKNNYLYHFNGNKDVALYNIAVDKVLKHNILSKEKGVSKELREFTEAVIQQYNNRMIDDRMVLKNKEVAK